MKGTVLELAKVKRVKIDYREKKNEFFAKFGLTKANTITHEDHAVLYNEVARCSDDDVEFKPEFTPKAKAEIRRRQR